MHTRNFELRIVILFLAVVLYLLGSYTQKKVDDNKTLKSSLQLLEFSLEQQKSRNQQQLDSLQQRILHQDHLQLQLKDSLRLLRDQRQHLKRRSHENKAAILRLRDADSLYQLVARHYR